MYSQVSSNGQCLLNTPTTIAIESTYASSQNPGQFLSPHDQCKMFNGNQSSFCMVN